MSKRELITQELHRLSEADLDRILDFLRILSDHHAERIVPVMAAEFGSFEAISAAREVLETSIKSTPGRLWRSKLRHGQKTCGCE